jgi:hypothetical protein
VIFIAFIPVAIEAKWIIGAEGAITAVREFGTNPIIDVAGARMHHENADVISRARS